MAAFLTISFLLPTTTIRYDIILVKVLFKKHHSTEYSKKRNITLHITGKCACHSQFATWYTHKKNNARSRLAVLCLNLRLHGFFQPLTEIYITPHHIHFTNLLPLGETISLTNKCHIYPIELSTNNRLGVKSLLQKRRVLEWTEKKAF